MKIAFLGAGSMAEAILSGILENQLCPSSHLWVTNHRSQSRLDDLQKKYDVQVTYDLEKLLQDADLVMIAVKPKDAKDVLQKVSHYITKETCVVSVMAGVSIDMISANLGTELSIARAMPNTSASVAKSVTAIAFNSIVSLEQQQLVQKVFTSIGIATVVQEKQLDSITALSGSGPAYFYYFVEAMETAAIQMGLEGSLAKELIIQTMNGAVHMLQETGSKAEDLRKKVTSPGGTTEAGLNILDSSKVAQTIVDCILTAEKRSKELASMYE